MLDELDGYRGLRKGRALGHIVVETRTANAVPLLRFSCSKRVIAMPTGHMNARRVSGAPRSGFRVEYGLGSSPWGLGCCDIVIVFHCSTATLRVTRMQRRRDCGSSGFRVHARIIALGGGGC